MNDEKFIEELIEKVTPAADSEEGTKLTAYFKCNHTYYRHWTLTCRLIGEMTSVYSTGEPYVRYELHMCKYNTSRECWFEFDGVDCTILDGKTSLEELEEQLDWMNNFIEIDEKTFFKDLKAYAYDEDENYERLVNSIT